MFSIKNLKCLRGNRFRFLKQKRLLLNLHNENSQILSETNKKSLDIWRKACYCFSINSIALDISK